MYYVEVVHYVYVIYFYIIHIIILLLGTSLIYDTYFSLFIKHYVLMKSTFHSTVTYFMMNKKSEAKNKCLEV